MGSEGLERREGPVRTGGVGEGGQVTDSMLTAENEGRATHTYTFIYLCEDIPELLTLTITPNLNAALMTLKTSPNPQTRVPTG